MTISYFQVTVFVLKTKNPLNHSNVPSCGAGLPKEVFSCLFRPLNKGLPGTTCALWVLKGSLSCDLKLAIKALLLCICGFYGRRQAAAYKESFPIDDLMALWLHSALEGKWAPGSNVCISEIVCLVFDWHLLKRLDFYNVPYIPHHCASDTIFI